MKKDDKKAKMADYYYHLYTSGKISELDYYQNSVFILTDDTLAKFLIFHELYKKVLLHPGSIFEFGVRLGRSLFLWSWLKAINEPGNFTRKIAGFDTFKGLTNYDPVFDGKKDNETKKESGFTTPDRWDEILYEMLNKRNLIRPEGTSGRECVEIIKGDVLETFPAFLQQNESDTCALAYFDMDIYIPTNRVLEDLLPRCSKGTVLLFDEFSYSKWPGEGHAVRDILDLNKYKLHANPMVPGMAWIIL